MRRVISLVHRREGGPLWVEPVIFDGPDEGAILADAAREGLGSCWGRSFEGLILGDTPDPAAGPPLPSRPADPPALSHPASALSPSVEPPVAPGADALAAGVAWHEHEGALGCTGRFGLALVRCRSTDKELALEAAQLVGAHLFHQRALYPVSAVAVPALLALLGAADTPGRALLAHSLARLGALTPPRRGALQGALRWIQRAFIGYELRDLDRAARRRRASAHACREALLANRPTLEALLADAQVGWAAATALRALDASPG